jgi:hypothetical protein
VVRSAERVQQPNGHQGPLGEIFESRNNMAIVSSSWSTAAETPGQRRVEEALQALREKDVRSAILERIRWMPRLTNSPVRRGQA